MITVAQAAAFLSISEPGVLNLIARGVFRARKVRRRWEIQPAGVRAYDGRRQARAAALPCAQRRLQVEVLADYQHGRDAAAFFAKRML